MNGSLLRYCLAALLLFVLAAPGWAQDFEGQLMLVVAVPPRVKADAPAVERAVAELKAERAQAGWDGDSLPLLRLAFGRPDHRAVLEQVPIAPTDGIATYLCQRGERGWPVRIIGRVPTRVTPAEFFRQLSQHVRPPERAPLSQLGVDLGLVVLSDSRDPDHKALVGPFLEELGQFWLARYGRISPAPYPLASYDTSNRSIEEPLLSAFPVLASGYGERPILALCRFKDGLPTQVLERYDDLDLPAGLVRQVSADRGLALSRPPEPKPDRDPFEEPLADGAAPPDAQSVALSQQQQKAAAIARLGESAARLWSLLNEDPDGSKTTQAGLPGRRGLLRVLEQCQALKREESGSLGSLRTALEAYFEEPLPEPEEPQLKAAQAEFDGLARSLLTEGP